MPSTANRLRQVRESQGRSQAELARQVGMTRQAMCRLEAGAWLPNTAVALRLARILGSTVEALFGTSAEPQVEHCDPQAPDAARLVLTRVRERVCAYALDAPGGLEPTFSAVRAAPGGQATPMAVLHGCDPAFGILADHLRDQGRHLLFRFASSTAALEQVASGRSHLAGIHLADADDRDSQRQSLRLVRQSLPQGGQVVAFARWEQGLVVAAGNPLGLRSVADLARPEVRFLNRAAGSGCRAMLERQMGRIGLAGPAIAGFDRCAASHWSTAGAIAAGLADAGLGLRAVAQAAGLAFLPLGAVRCDLVIPADLTGHPAVEAAIDALSSRRLRGELGAVAGYDVTETGRVVAELAAA